MSIRRAGLKMSFPRVAAARNPGFWTAASATAHQKPLKLKDFSVACKSFASSAIRVYKRRSIRRTDNG